MTAGEGMGDEMRTVVLDFRDFKTSEEVHVFLAEHLEFPAYYGRNLDALYDMLASEDRPTNILVISGGHSMETGFLNVLCDASEENPRISYSVRET